MFGFVMVIHVIVSILLIVIILMQSGRGGGLTATFSSMESIFGTKTNVFLVRATAVLAVLFLITCLSLAYLSKIRSKSLIEEQAAPIEETTVIPTTETEPQVENKTEEVKHQSSEIESAIKEQETENNIEETEKSSNQQ